MPSVCHHLDLYLEKAQTLRQQIWYFGSLDEVGLGSFCVYVFFFNFSSHLLSVIAVAGPDLQMPSPAMPLLIH